MNPSSKLWAQAATIYRASQDSDVLNNFYIAALFKCIGSVKGKTCLDAGCGDGRYSIALAKKGADVTGIDNVSQFLDMANARNCKTRVRFQHADLTRSLPFRARSFDVILANMVLMDLPVINLTVREFSRVLKPRGLFVFSIVHPCFFPFKWKYRSKRRAYKMVDDYFTRRTIPLDFWGRTLHFHRPLGFYTEVLRKHGFAITEMIEPSPEKDHSGRNPEWEHRARIPSFLVISAVKTSFTSSPKQKGKPI